VGGVSEGPTRGIRLAEQSGDSNARRSRNGRRHPGLRDDVDLRGSASERGSWFGPASRTGLLPSRRTHRRQRMSRGRRGRERRPHALFEAHAPDTRNAGNRLSRDSADDASFTWSSDPCTLIATSTPSERSAEVARRSRYRGRENLVKARRNRHRGLNRRTLRGSPLVTASARERAWQVRKGRASRRSSQRGS